MRTFWKRVLRGVALLALLVVVGLPSALAGDDASNPFEPPHSRIKPPSGIASQARIGPVGGRQTADARIQPPSGRTTPDPSWFDLLIDWLRVR